MQKRESKSEAFTANPFTYKFMYAPFSDQGVYDYEEKSVEEAVKALQKRLEEL